MKPFGGFWGRFTKMSEFEKPEEIKQFIRGRAKYTAVSEWGAILLGCWGALVGNWRALFASIILINMCYYFHTEAIVLANSVSLWDLDEKLEKMEADG